MYREFPAPPFSRRENGDLNVMIIGVHPDDPDWHLGGMAMLYGGGSILCSCWKTD